MMDVPTGDISSWVENDEEIFVRFTPRDGSASVTICRRLPVPDREPRRPATNEEVEFAVAGWRENAIGVARYFSPSEVLARTDSRA